MPIAAGTRFGSYEVTGTLGAGGMGEVYRAHDGQLGRDVAIKVLPASFTSDAGRVARFEQEAKTLASLNHANIAHIYGLERADDSTAIVMELVEGPTLAERIAQGPIPVDDALRIAIQIADALEAAHARGIVHRDLKPANIKLRPDGGVKVLDFGIAKALDVRATSGSLPPALTTPAMTAAGIVLGTAAYMSPEQAKGKPLDQRTDVWAFGCVLYEMLTGQAAFLGEDVTSTLARVLERPANLRALPVRVSPAVRHTLELCLEKDARERIADLRDVKLALAGKFMPDAATPSIWRRALPAAAMLALGATITGTYFLSVRPEAAAPAEPTEPLPVSRFTITPPATAPLASEGGLDLAISPDGKRIAYIAQKDDASTELYVRELDALEAHAIPGSDEGADANRNLFFSADGRSIGYQGSAGIVTATIDGRPSVKLLDRQNPTFQGGSWTADNQIVYSSSRQLWRASATGAGTPEPLGSEAPAGQGIAAPVPLPGGHAVIFHAYGGPAGDRVAALDLATGEEKTLVDGGSNPAYLDTGHLVFVRGNTLMAVPFSAAELAVTGEPVALVQGIRRVSGGAADYALSANGTLAYVPAGAESDGGTAALVWVNRAGEVVERAVADLVANPRFPRISPDGKRLLLVTGGPNQGALWSYDLGGRPPIPLALAGDNSFPVWSPDGQQVAFYSGLAGTIVSLPADGSVRTPQSVGNFGIAVPQNWSAAGELIFVKPPGDIMAAAATGGEARLVVASDASEFDAALSPNGRWLAYASSLTGQAEIWVRPYPDGVPVRVSSNGGFEPLWSADGRELFYQRTNGTMAVAVETGAEFSFGTPQPLFSGAYYRVPGPFNQTYDVAPDGRFLMILPGDERRAAAPASIVVVQNFGEELKQRVRPGTQ